MGVPHNRDKFIEKAKIIHGNTYDYAQVEYINSTTKVKIGCKEHGIFQQLPNDHTSHKNGCPKCANIKTKQKNSYTLETALKIFKEKHLDEYNYDKFEYKGTFVKSIVTCKIHGDFLISPTSHISGQKCPQCTKLNKSYIKNGKEVVYITEDIFYKRAFEKYGIKYDYTYAKYIDSDTTLEIKCNIHNHLFLQTPRNHLLSTNGGCLKCKSEVVKTVKLKSSEDFIKNSNITHNNLYDYSKVVYKGNKRKVIIICKHHGEFEQKPNDHTSGHGCKKCGQKGSTYNIVKAERNKEDWLKIQTVLYLIEFKSDKENYIKIGISNERELRHSVLERVSKCTIIDSLIIDIDLYNAVLIEQSIIKSTSECKYIPLENYAGYTECFTKNCKEIVKNKILDYIKENGK